MPWLPNAGATGVSSTSGDTAFSLADMHFEPAFPANHEE